MLDSWDEFGSSLDKKLLIMAPFCGDGACEDLIKQNSARDSISEAPVEPGAPSMGAKTLCIPFEQPKPLAPDQQCVRVACGRLAMAYTLFGRSY